VIRQVLGALALIVFGVTNSIPVQAQTQTSGLAITIVRPGEGETMYSSPASGFVAVPITGFVSAFGLDVNQLQVRLDIYNGTKVTGSLTTTPLADGTFSFDVGINTNSVDDAKESEAGCDSRCHMQKLLNFPPGHVIFHVSVSDPLGHTTTAERSIIVDVSGYADLPVQVVGDGAAGHALAGVRVVAASRLYLWRAREFSAVTDAFGRATIHLERLSQAPTHYVLQLEPRIVDNTFVAGCVPVSLTILAGATALPPLVVVAQTQRGQIQGTIADFQNRSDLTVRAIPFSGSAAFTIKTIQGKFNLSNLPLDKYLVTIDDADSISQGIQAEPQTIDLASASSITMTLKLASDATRVVRGVVHDMKGTPIPFVWLANERKDKFARVAPTSGEFIMGGLSGGDRMLWVTAPGYWSQPVAVADRLDIALTPMPNTRSVLWGAGKITVPELTRANIAGNEISIERGWIWGSGTGAMTIHTPEINVAMQAGSFALEYVAGETNWLYVMDGQAQVTAFGADKTVMVSANQMLASGKETTNATPIALDADVVRALHSNEPSQVYGETDTAIIARVHDEIERRGISSTFVALGLGLAVAAFLVGVGWQRRRR
jgi:hypothetical protein